MAGKQIRLDDETLERLAKHRKGFEKAGETIKRLLDRLEKLEKKKGNK